MRQGLLAAFMILFVGFSFAQTSKMKTYCNARFQFCIQYPKDFKGQEAYNGDGKTFKTTDKNAVIFTWGNLATDDIANLEEYYKISAEDNNVTYSIKKKNYFIISGTNKDGGVFYQKTQIKTIKYYGTPDNDNTAVFQSLYITYPLSLKEKYASYCTYISKCTFD